MSTRSIPLQVKARGIGPGIIARELVLELAEGTVWPKLLEHVLGKANVVADALSRKFQPGVDFTLPAPLEGVPGLVLPPR